MITKDEEGNQAYVPHVNIQAKVLPISSSKGPFYLISRLNDLVLTIPENKNAPGEYPLLRMTRTKYACILQICPNMGQEKWGFKSIMENHG